MMQTLCAICIENLCGFHNSTLITKLNTERMLSPEGINFRFGRVAIVRRRHDPPRLYLAAHGIVLVRPYCTGRHVPEERSVITSMVVKK